MSENNSNANLSVSLTTKTNENVQIDKSKEKVSAIDANISVAESLPSAEFLTSNENIAPSESIKSNGNTTKTNEDETINNAPKANNPFDSLLKEDSKDDDKKIEMMEDEAIHADTNQTSTAPTPTPTTTPTTPIITPAPAPPPPPTTTTTRTTPIITPTAPPPPPPPTTTTTTTATDDTTDTTAINKNNDSNKNNDDHNHNKSKKNKIIKNNNENDLNNLNDQNDKTGTLESSDVTFVDTSSRAPQEATNNEDSATADVENFSSEVSVAATSVSAQEEGEVVRLKKNRPKKSSSDSNHHHRHRNHHQHQHQHQHQHHSRHHNHHRHSKRPTYKHHSNHRQSHGTTKKDTAPNTDSNHKKSSPKRIDGSHSNKIKLLNKEDTGESMRSLISPLMVNNPEFSSNNFLAPQSKPLMTVSMPPIHMQTVQPNNNKNSNNNNNSTELRDKDKKFTSTDDAMSELTIQTNTTPSLDIKEPSSSFPATPSSPNIAEKNKPSNSTVSQNHLLSGNEKSVPLVPLKSQDEESVQENNIFNMSNDSMWSMHDSGPLLAVDDSEWKSMSKAPRKSNTNKSNQIFLQNDNHSNYEIIRDKPDVTHESNTKNESKTSSCNTNATTMGSKNQDESITTKKAEHNCDEDESLNEVKRIKKPRKKGNLNKLYRSKNQRNVHDETRVKGNNTNKNKSVNKETVYLLENNPTVITEDVDLDNNDKKVYRKKRGCIKRLLISSMCITLLSIIIVILIIYIRKSKTSKTQTTIYVNVPTSTPTKFLRLSSSPTSVQYSDMAGFIRFSEITNNTKLLTPGTPQNNALGWFVNDPIQRERDKSDKRFLQRFVLGVFYFSLSEESIYGNGWHMCSKEQRCSVDQKISWLSAVDECKWAMIKCDKSGYVIEISALRENNMFGTLPEEIYILNSLQKLEIQRNYIYGTIPSSWSKFSNLKSMVFSDNYIEGAIPESLLVNLPLLEELIVDNNEFSGPLPSGLFSLTSLIRLRLNFNRFSGAIPSKIKKLSNLVELELIQNKLTGQLTSNIGHLSHLSKLDVSHNMLSGEVPNEILRMGSLNQLYLNNNMLSGELPDDIKYFGDKTKRSLKMLRFDSNEFSGTIPSEVGQIQLLRVLNFTANNFSGGIPDEICKSTGSYQKDLKFLQVDCEKVACSCCQPTCFESEIIERMRVMSDIDDIILWKSPRTAQNMAMSWYTFEDSLGYDNLESFSFERYALAVLYFATNGDQWTSSDNFISERAECEWEGIICEKNDGISEIVLPAHNLVGYIPREIGYISSLTVLELQANSLKGTLPKELGRLKDIKTFYVNDNKLEGTLPITIYDLYNMNDFSVSGNMLTGTIDSRVGKMGSQSAQRKRYMLQKNRFIGSIPSDFSRIPNLVYLGLHFNEFEGTIPEDFCSNKMSISIDCNRLFCTCCQCMN